MSLQDFALDLLFVGLGSWFPSANGPGSLDLGIDFLKSLS